MFFVIVEVYLRLTGKTRGDLQKFKEFIVDLRLDRSDLL